ALRVGRDYREPVAQEKSPIDKFLSMPGAKREVLETFRELAQSGEKVSESDIAQYLRDKGVPEDPNDPDRGAKLLHEHFFPEPITAEESMYDRYVAEKEDTKQEEKTDPAPSKPEEVSEPPVSDTVSPTVAEPEEKANTSQPKEDVDRLQWAKD